MEGRHPSGTEGSYLSEVTTRETCVEALPRRSFSSRVLFQRIRLEIRKEGEEGADIFDTDAPPFEGEAAETPFARRTAPYRRLAGSSITMTQRPSGLVEAVGGTEALRAKMTEGIPEDDPLRGAVERLLGLGSMKFMIGPNILVPEKPASPGEATLFQDIRPLPETVGVPGLVYYRGEARLASIEEGVARIEIKADVSLDPGPGMPPWPKAAIPFRSRMRLQRGICTGFARIRVEDGVLLEEEHRTELDLFFTPPDGSPELPLPTTAVRSTILK